MGAHDDDRQGRPGALDTRQHIEAVLIGHDHVGNHQIAFAVGDPAPQSGGVAGAAHHIAFPRKSLIDHGADRLIVIGDEDSVGSAHGAASS